MPNKIYQVGETAIVFGSEVGDDVAWSTESIADAAGRQSAFYDRGALSTAKAREYHYRFYTQLQATPTVGERVRLLLKTSDGTHPDNDDGTGDAAVSAADKLRNLKIVDFLYVDEAAANIEMVASGPIEIFDRYAAFVLWNDSGATITADAAETKLILTPVPTEIQ